MDVYQRRRLIALSAIAAFFIIIVLLIRSCGGDDEASPTTPLAGATGVGGATTLSQDDYIAQADVICRDSNNALAEVDQSDPDAAAAEEQQVLEGELQQLQTLPTPDDGQDKLDKFLGALDDQVTALTDRTKAADRGDTATVADLDAAAEEAGATAQKAAKKFGFEACGNPSAVSETTGGSGGGSTSGGTEAVTPTTTTPAATTPVAPATPPADTGGAGTAPPATPPADTGTGGGTGGTGGVSP